MFYGLYNLETGIIRKVVQGPEEWVATIVEAGEGFIASELELDDSLQAVDVTKTPPVVIAASRAKTPAELIPEILRERTRRLGLGFTYDFGDTRGTHHIGTSDEDMRGWTEVTQLAAALIAAGETTPIAIITETGPTTVTPREWQLILIAAGTARQPIWQASFALQAMSPIPQDISNDAYWQGVAT